MTVSKNSPLIDKVAIGGLFSGLPNKILRMVERDDKAIFPPFEDYKAQVGDVLMDAAMRKALAETLTNNQDALIGSRVFHCFYIPNGQSGPWISFGASFQQQNLVFRVFRQPVGRDSLG